MAAAHCVPGITLPPGDAKLFSLLTLACQSCEEEIAPVMIVPIYVTKVFVTEREDGDQNQNTRPPPVG